MPFATTRWSLVVAAGDSRHPAYRDALAELCQLYWMPVYSWARRQVRDPEAAGDLTQGFFAHLLEKDTLRAADRDRGRFRTFLLTALKFYAADEWDRARAQKRGGGATPVPLDAGLAETRLEPAAPDDTPERAFDRQWARALLDHVQGRLRAEVEAGEAPARVRLVGVLTDPDEARYKDLAADLGMSESAVKVAVHRLRRRFAALLREEVARTVDDPAGVEDELRFLLAAISR